MNVFDLGFHGILLSAPSAGSGPDKSCLLNLEELTTLKGYIRYFTLFGSPGMTWIVMRFMGNQLLTKGLKYYYNSKQHFNSIFCY